MNTHISNLLSGVMRKYPPNFRILNVLLSSFKSNHKQAWMYLCLILPDSVTPKKDLKFSVLLYEDSLKFNIKKS